MRQHHLALAELGKAYFYRCSKKQGSTAENPHGIPGRTGRRSTRRAGT
jgi:hypothetical protein